MSHRSTVPQSNGRSASAADVHHTGAELNALSPTSSGEGREGEVRPTDSDRSARSATNRPLHKRDRIPFSERVKRDALQQADQAPVDEAFESSCPDLFDLLTRTVYAGGKTRTPSDVVITCIGGLWSATLHEHDTHQQKSALALTWADLPAALEHALSDPGNPWRVYKSKRASQGLKRLKEK
jgi:hypothetical protein